jgi:hypothetical protein
MFLPLKRSENGLESNIAPSSSAETLKKSPAKTDETTAVKSKMHEKIRRHIDSRNILAGR